MKKKNDMFEERPKGVSAFIIVNADTEWLGQSIESIMPLFDEILVIPLKENEEAVNIAKSFTAHKVKKIEAPVIKTDNCPENGIYDQCKKWAIMNSKYSHVCEWGTNMLMIQEFVSDDFHRKIISTNFLKFRGYNITSKSLNKISKEKPETELKNRAYRVTKDIIKKNKQDSVINTYVKAKRIKDPVYISTENIKQNSREDEKIDLDLPSFFFKKSKDYLK